MPVNYSNSSVAMKPFAGKTPIHDANLIDLAISSCVKGEMPAGRVLASLLVTLSKRTCQDLVKARLAFDPIDLVPEVEA
jgi:hypothetical protein